MGWLNINGNWIGRNRGGQKWSSYWSHQSEVLFFGLYSEISGGQMPNRVDGGATYLTVAGSAGSETYQAPDTAPYQTADTDYIWFRSDTTQRTVTTAELIGYDLQRTPVKYDDTSPNAIVAIMILNAAVTGTKRDKMFADMWLSILWDNNFNGSGHVKSNRITYNPYIPLKFLDKPLGTEYAYLADNTALDVVDAPFLICGWVKAYDKSATCYLWGKNVAGSINGRYGLAYNITDGFLYFGLQGSGVFQVISSTVDATSGWHFIISEVYYINTQLQIRLYVDDNYIGNTSMGYATLGTLDNKFEFYIGTGNDGAGTSVIATSKAAFRDVRIYRIALTNDEKTQLYNNIDVPGYVARWKCDAYPLVDETGNYNLNGVNLSAANIKEI